MAKDPLVSISCISFNQEAYIKECLDGFLNQKTNFEFEILIHDDASTDGTKEIIEGYAKKHPDIIKPILQEKNQYGNGVRGIMAKFNYPRAKGKYIANCEGDDFWIDEYKLQKQVDFLEANDDFGLVHTDFNVFYEHTNELVEAMNNKSSFNYSNITSDFTQLLIKNHVSTCTVLFRTDLLNQIDLNVLDSYSHGDLPLWFEMSQITKFKYLDLPTAVYRVRGESMSNSQSKLKRLNFLIGSKKIKMDYSAKYGTEIQKRKAKYEYFHRVLIKATYDKDLMLATQAFKQLPFRNKKDYTFYLFTRSKFLNNVFLKYRKAV